MSAQMDQLITQFRAFQEKTRQAETRWAGVGDLQEQIARVRTSVTAPDGTVTVVAGAGGTVTDVQLSPEALRLDPARLSATIMGTLREAVAGAVRQQAGIVDEAFGDTLGIDVSEQVREAQAEAFGTTAEAPASQGGPAAPPAARPEDDDYFDAGSFLRR
ncbi:YbaB/EbfC family nucleoid-associated protein [Amycolatopsis sp. PS_44_ISF1]|uniref:YbaB/EbfC family nucleoid-associated protein n=1 Tax=Amycolatopsis sp. PS_44_ISF1 TaxID=2974917 RepID=UPI0028DDD3F7|nr:YbaB/EbfC family nucleoid-associated protein [Amycolatopsis sp. PS_44_ISF1]MDT8915286.1 YbaB/EbfC family nucleoid-associated protein [Amycolatopsis sp. PS_44_ISF1]